MSPPGSPLPRSPLLVLVAGDPVPRVRVARGGFADLIRAAAGGTWSGPWLEVDLRDGSPLPAHGEVAAAIVTGSAASVTERAPWILRGEEWLRGAVAARLPTFGICFGHQMLGQALGGEVAKNPRGREIGSTDLEIVAPDPLFDGADRAHPPFRVNNTHVDTIERLPPGASVLARTQREPHAAVRFGEAAWGVQFHPEMDAQVARGYVEERRDLIMSEGLDADAILASIDDAAVGASTLTRFLELVSSTPSGAALRFPR